jgi:hypothetical protein
MRINTQPTQKIIKNILKYFLVFELKKLFIFMICLYHLFLTDFYF